MRCERWSDLLLDHAVGELGDEDAVLLEQHVAECAACARDLAELSALLRSASRPDRIDPEAPEEAGLEALRRRIWAEHRRSLLGQGRRVTPARRAMSPGVSWWAILRRPAPILAAAVLLGVGSLIGHVATRNAADAPAPPVLSAPDARETKRPEPRGPLDADRPLVDFVSVPSEIPGLSGRVEADTL